LGSAAIDVEQADAGGDTLMVAITAPETPTKASRGIASSATTFQGAGVMGRLTVRQSLGAALVAELEMADRKCSSCRGVREMVPHRLRKIADTT
jgi:hypothetical protein